MHASIAQFTTTDRLKQAAAVSAATPLENGMLLGLGCGTTATLAVAAIGQRVKQGLRIVGIPTSSIWLASNRPKLGQAQGESKSPQSERKPFITDGGNYILDCAFGPLESASTLQWNWIALSE